MRDYYTAPRNRKSDGETGKSRNRCSAAGEGKCPVSIDQTGDWGSGFNPAARGPTAPSGAQRPSGKGEPAHRLGGASGAALAVTVQCPHVLTPQSTTVVTH